MRNYTDSALRYYESGMKTIPFWNGVDGKKAFPEGYAKFRDGQTVEDIQRLFARDCDGIALLCTDNIEVIDIDTKHDTRGTLLSDFIQAIDDFGFSAPSVVQSTKSGGAHIIYKAPTTGGNQKLARRAGEKEAIIETRGQGGILFVYPTPGYLVQEGDIYNIPTIPQEQRDLLIAISKHFDESVQDAEPIPAESVSAAQPGLKPFDDYNQRTRVLDLAIQHGWIVLARRGDYVRLNRPGAKHSKGVDATVHESKNKFYPFTSSSDFEPGKSFSAAAFYTVMNHRGDYKSAAKALYSMGYGELVLPSASSTSQPLQAEEPTKVEVEDLIACAALTKFKYGQRPKEPTPMLIMHHTKAYKIGGRGMIGVFIGHEKSGKSYVLSCIAASGLKGKEIINFQLDLDGGKMLGFDMEQSGFFFYKTQERIYSLAGLKEESPIYSAYHLRSMTPEQRLKVVEFYVYNTPGISCLIIDGFVDMVTDYNDLKTVQAFVNTLMKWSDEKNLLILGVLHVNKGDGKIRGHLGSELKNKCDFVINTAKNDGGYFTVTNPTSRYGQFPDIEFTRDPENGNPVYRSYYEESFSGSLKSNQFPATAPVDYTISQSARPSADFDIPF